MIFSNAYAACTVSSPTRASIMTGKYPAKLHLTNWIKGHKIPNAKLKIPDLTKYLPLEETTLAEVYNSKGYFSPYANPDLTNGEKREYLTVCLSNEACKKY